MEEKGACYCMHIKKAHRNHFIWGRVFSLLNTLFSCDISSECILGNGLRLPHPLGIVISEKAIIEDNCTIFQNVTIGLNEHKANYDSAPLIGKNVYIGAGAVLIGKKTIGDDVIIGANATITKSIPNGLVVVGDNRIIEGKIERNPHPNIS